jgi:hypothetical protein
MGQIHKIQKLLLCRYCSAMKIICSNTLNTTKKGIKKMKISIYVCLLSVLSFISCSDDSLPSSSQAPESSSARDQKVSSTATVTGLTNFKVANLSIPSSGIVDGKRFYSDGSLRANIAHYPYALMKVTKNGLPRIRFYVKPTAPTPSLLNGVYQYHHRAEFTRYPWTLNLPYRTEEWIGFSYLFPTAAEGFTQNQTPVSIYQNHPGRIPGMTINPPAVQLEIAYPNQLKNYADPAYQTPYGGEIMIINNVRGIRYVAPGVRVVPGARLDIIIQLVYGTGSDGLFNVWINGKLMEFQGNSQVERGNVGSTVWPEFPYGGNSKFGLYHHQEKYKSGVDKNYAKGHTNMIMWMTDWNDVFRHPGDWDYKNINAYGAVDTSTYP